MEPQHITLTEVLQLAGDIPAEGILKVLGAIVYKTRTKELSLTVDSPVEELYSRFRPTEGVERTFAYLFAVAGDKPKAVDSYGKLISFLENREAYGMAADAAMEADALFGGTDIFKGSACRLYEQQVQKMGHERSSYGETNEHYYDEILLKLGRLGSKERMEQYEQRVESGLQDCLSRGFFGPAANILNTLNRKEEAQRYRKLDELLRIT